MLKAHSCDTETGVVRVHDNEFSNEEIRETLQAIVSSESFARSPQLIDFLRYIVEAKLSGQADSLKAYTIAVDVFGRGTDFDPQSDSIVRVQAGRLRQLLSQLYESGTPALKLHIHLPVGRYIPLFSAVAEGKIEEQKPQKVTTMPSEKAKLATFRRRNFVFFGAILLASVMLALIIAGGILGMSQRFVGQKISPEQAQIDTHILSLPILVVGNFTEGQRNNTIDPRLIEFPRYMVDRLHGFEELEVRLTRQFQNFRLEEFGGRRVYDLTGVLRFDGDSVQLNAWMSRRDSAEVVWSRTLRQNMSSKATEEVLDGLAIALSAELGSLRGPVHDDAQRLLTNPRTRFAPVSEYKCMLLYDAALGWGNVEKVERAEACLTELLLQVGDNFRARLALAEVKAASLVYAAHPDENLRAKLYGMLFTGHDVAFTLSNDSFTRTQYGRILELAGDIDAAEAEYWAAINLNPANVDAHAALGRMLVLNGRWTKGITLSNKALAMSPIAAPWYYTGKALNSLRLEKYDEVIEAARILEKDDLELASVLMVVAAVAQGRADMLARYRPIMLNQPAFANYGVMARISVRLKAAPLLKLIRKNLIAAGLSTSQLRG